MNKRLLPIIVAVFFLVTLVFWRHSKSAPIEQWQFTDKSGEVVTIERITSGDLRENEPVYISAYTKWLQASPEVVSPYVPSVYPTIEAFLKTAFDEERSEFEQHKPTSYFVRAVRKGIVVGYMLFEIQESRAFLRSLATAPEVQGLGIGKALVGGIFKMRPDMQRAWLMVSRDNPVAIALYQRLGFKENAVLAPAQMDQKTWMSMELLGTK